MSPTFGNPQSGKKQCETQGELDSDGEAPGSVGAQRRPYTLPGGRGGQKRSLVKKGSKGDPGRGRHAGKGLEV